VALGRRYRPTELFHSFVAMIFPNHWQRRFASSLSSPN
jgi:hypothetical protein